MRGLPPVVLALLIAACGGGGNNVVTPPPPPPGSTTVASVTIAQVGTLHLVSGETVTLTAVPRSADGVEVPGKSVTWAVTPPDRASISTTGVLTAIVPGSATVTATVDGISATIGVDISSSTAAVNSISVVDPGVAPFLAGMTTLMTTILLDANGNRIAGRAVSWSSSDTTVVRMTGINFRAVGPGTAIVTATCEGKTAQYLAKVEEGALIPITGGQATGLGGAVSVQIPIGSLTNPLPLQISPTDVGVYPPGYIANTGFDTHPDAALLDISATVKITYPVSAVPNGVDETQLRLHRWDGTAWVPVSGSTVDVASHTVTGMTKVLGSYAVLKAN